MKTYLTVWCMLVSCIYLSAQEAIPTTSCSFYNSLEIDQNASYFADEILPSGIILFDVEKTIEFQGIENFVAMLGLSEANEFLMVNSRASLFDENMQHVYYQQYYEGLLVEGGGFTVSALWDEPTDPCAEFYNIFYPNIIGNLDINTSPEISEAQAISNFSAVSKADLVITPNVSEDCSPKLTWKINHVDEVNKSSWVDAQSGIILKTISSDADLLAETETYGTVFLNNHFFENNYHMATEDLRVLTFDFTSEPINSGQPFYQSFSIDRIAQTEHPEHWLDVTNPQVYQTHWLVTEILPFFDEWGFDFPRVDVAAGNFPGAFYSQMESTDDISVVKIGRWTDGLTLALRDVVAHELGHAAIDKINIAYESLESKTIHEAVADMLSVYIESIFQSSEDWILADDNGLNVRDLQNPMFPCYNQAIQSEDQYLRGGAYRRWFYLLVNGEGTMPGIGLEQATQIVLETLAPVISYDDYQQFMAKSQVIVNDIFGICSQQSKTLSWAWKKVCVSSIEAPDCDFEVQGPLAFNVLNVQPDGMVLTGVNAPQGSSYIWNFPFGWEVPGASGNQFTGNPFKVTDFPAYPWYPRHYSVNVHLSIDPLIKRRHRVKLYNPNGPTCQEYYTSSYYIAPPPGEIIATEFNPKSAQSVIVYDLMGRLLYRGAFLDYEQNQIPYSGIQIIQYLDEQDRVMETKKIFKLD